MQNVSAQFLKAVRNSHTVYVRVDVWVGSKAVAKDVPITGGQVTVNSGTGVRRTLDVDIADRSLWTILSTPGAQIRPYRGVRFPGGGLETVGLGVFIVDSVTMSASYDGGIQVSAAPDRWSFVQRARFESPDSSIPGNTAVSEAIRLITSAYPVGVTRTATSTADAGALVYEKDREEPINSLLAAAGAEAFFGVDGQLVVRDVPLLSSNPVWTVDAGKDGILLGGNRRRDRTRTYNVVVVSVEALDGQTVPSPVIVADTDATSPTYVGGPMGRVPYFYSSPVFLDEEQMATAGASILNRVKGVNAQLDIETVVNPALDAGDVVQVKTADGTLERHLIVGLTVPLTVEGTQSITTQSSRPQGDVPGGE